MGFSSPFLCLRLSLRETCVKVPLQLRSLEQRSRQVVQHPAAGWEGNHKSFVLRAGVLLCTFPRPHGPNACEQRLTIPFSVTFQCVKPCYALLK